MDKKEIADRIFALLDQTDMEQQEFARLVGVSDDTASNWRRYKSASFTKFLPQIAGVLITTEKYLLTGQKEKPTVQDDGLTQIEQELISLFRRLTPEQQDFVIGSVRAAADKM